MKVEQTLIAQGPVDVKVSRECPECGSTDTEWHCSQTTNSGVVDGRLRMHDVSTVFYLGCNCCSETICTMSGDEVAQRMNTTANKCRWCGHDALAHDKQYGCAEDGCDCETPNANVTEAGHWTKDRIEQLETDRENLLQLLESASEVIGRFVSDEGWAQSDMDMMDAIDAKIASVRSRI